MNPPAANNGMVQVFSKNRHLSSLDESKVLIISPARAYVQRINVDLGKGELADLKAFSLRRRTVHSMCPIFRL